MGEGGRLTTGPSTNRGSGSVLAWLERGQVRRRGQLSGSSEFPRRRPVRAATGRASPRWRTRRGRDRRPPPAGGRREPRGGRRRRRPGASLLVEDRGREGGDGGDLHGALRPPAGGGRRSRPRRVRHRGDRLPVAAGPSDESNCTSRKLSSASYLPVLSDEYGPEPRLAMGRSGRPSLIQFVVVEVRADLGRDVVEHRQQLAGVVDRAVGVDDLAFGPSGTVVGAGRVLAGVPL